MDFFHIVPENHQIEYKQSWRDEYLKTLCGFANAGGGELFVGINNQNKATGAENAAELLETLPNKISQKLGIYANVQEIKKQGKKIIRIAVAQYEVPISFNGKYYIRSGSTTQELKDKELTRFLLSKTGNSWEEQTEERASIKDIDTKIISRFKKLARSRILSIMEETPIQVLNKLGVLDSKGKPKRAAILLFGKEPRKFYASAYLKIGKFLSDTDLVSTDDMEGNLFVQLEKTFELLRTKYLLSPVRYEGLYRKESLEYPEAALREAIINALIHKDYTGAHIQMKIYPDKIILWNEGRLPEGITVESLTTVHPSIPRNELIAGAFFKAGLIETWGRGTVKITENCISAGLPAPQFREAFGGIEVTFNKDIYTEKYLGEKGLNERQIKAVGYVKKKDKITNADYQKICGVNRITATRDIQDLIEKKIFSAMGSKGRGAYYVIASIAS